MKLCVLLPVLVVWGLASGCGTVRPVIDHSAHVKGLEDGRFQVQIHYIEKHSGGPCFNGLAWFRTTTYNYTDLIVLNSLEGRVDAGQISVLPCSAGWTLKSLRGAITFTNGMMLVRLRQPSYARSDEPRDYVPYYLNGDYKITHAVPYR